MATDTKKDNKFYARSILEMVRPKVDVIKAEEDFGDLVTLVNKNLELKKFLQDPTMTFQERLASVLKIFADIKDPSSVAIITVLTIFDKLDDIEDIYQEFRGLVDALKKQVFVEVLSAIELDKKMLDEIKESVDKRTDLDVRIRNTVDASVVGGIVIKIGDRVIDLSLRGKIEDLRRQLKSIELRGEEFGSSN